MQVCVKYNISPQGDDRGNQDYDVKTAYYYYLRLCKVIFILIRMKNK